MSALAVLRWAYTVWAVYAQTCMLSGITVISVDMSWTNQTGTITAMNIVRIVRMRDKELQKKTNKERYWFYREKGICTKCGQVWAEPGRPYCINCQKKNRIQLKQGDPDGQKHRDLNHSRRAERLAQGLCTECGKPLENPQYKQCKACRQKRAEACKLYRIRKRLERESR